jgi:hypothetical protein
MLMPMAHEPRIVIVRCRTGTNAIVAARATIQVNHHRLRPVNKSLFNEKL